MNKAVAILYQVGLLMAAVMLPLSNVGMSIAGFWLSGTWLIDQWATEPNQRRYRWSKALHNPLFWILSGLFLIHLVGLVYTSDWQYALRDLRIKLPLLLFPLIFFTARPLEGRVLRRMLLFFVVSSSLAALYCLLIPLGVIHKPVTNIRDISVFISHIRFSILLVFATAVLLLWVSERKHIGLALPLMAINVSFLWVIESLTGAVMLSAVVLLYLVSEEASVLNRNLRNALRLVLPIGLVATLAWFGWLAYQHLRLDDDQLKALPIESGYGTPYEHHHGNTQKENGHLIWYCIARSELDTAWANRSSYGLDDLDGRGHHVYTTLLRYMTSRGLTKDAQGLAELSDEEIAHIESGVTSVLEFEHSGLRRRFDKILFELALLNNGGNPSGGSVIQRFEFWKAAWFVISKKPFFGVGTGDVKWAMDDAYNAIESQLYEQFRLRAHNQFLTFWLTFGVFGFLLLLTSLFLPIGVPATERGFLFTVFCLIVAMSYLTEDTLETQAGVTFVSFYAALFSSQRLAFHARIRSQNTG